MSRRDDSVEEFKRLYEQHGWDLSVTGQTLGDLVVYIRELETQATQMRECLEEIAGHLDGTAWSAKTARECLSRLPKPGVG